MYECIMEKLYWRPFIGQANVPMAMAVSTSYSVSFQEAKGARTSFEALVSGLGKAKLACVGLHGQKISTFVRL